MKHAVDKSSLPNDVLHKAEFPRLAQPLVPSLGSSEIAALIKNLRSLGQFVPQATQFNVEFGKKLAGSLGKRSSIEAEEFAALMKQSFCEAKKPPNSKHKNTAEVIATPDNMLALCVALKYVVTTEAEEEFVFELEKIFSKTQARERASLETPVLSHYEQFTRRTSPSQELLKQGRPQGKAEEDLCKRLEQLSRNLPLQLSAYDCTWWKDTRKICLAALKIKSGGKRELELRECANELLSLDRAVGVEVFYEISREFYRMAKERGVREAREFAELFKSAASCLSEGKRFYSSNVLSCRMRTFRDITSGVSVADKAFLTMCLGWYESFEGIFSTVRAPEPAYDEKIE